MTFASEESGQILSQDAQGRVLVSRERREALLEEYDRSGMSAVKFAQYVGIKYSKLAYWLQSRRRHRQREKLLVKAGADTEPGKSNGGGLKRWLRTLQGLACRQARYGFTLPEAPTVRSVAQVKRPWLRSCLDGWAQSDDQLQRQPEDLFVSRDPTMHLQRGHQTEQV
jgi:hypothetical protein